MLRRRHAVAGGKDDSRYFTDADPCRPAPAPKTLFTLFGAGHPLGGVSGYDAAETTDENPGRVAALGSLTSACLCARSGCGAHDWREDCEALTTGPAPGGRDEFE